MEINSWWVVAVLAVVLIVWEALSRIAMHELYGTWSRRRACQKIATEVVNDDDDTR